MVDRHKQGDRLDMVLDIPGDSSGPFCVEADVVWQKASCVSEEECKFLTGVVFSRIQDHHKKCLLDYVSENHPQEFRSRWWEGV
jgi:hypothetical protein